MLDGLTLCVVEDTAMDDTKEDMLDIKDAPLDVAPDDAARAALVGSSRPVFVLVGQFSEVTVLAVAVILQTTLQLLVAATVQEDCEDEGVAVEETLVLGSIGLLGFGSGSFGSTGSGIPSRTSSITENVGNSGRVGIMNVVPQPNIHLKSPRMPPPPQPALRGSSGLPPRPQRSIAPCAPPQPVLQYHKGYTATYICYGV
ncbi:MAG: hypothetical protein M1827_001936 [Pycnora praestabilis]|nr:MAG: hypothetical protein M1827_001936 [Pycnora praestabilis]